MSNYTDYLRELYYTPGKPGAFAGPEKLYQAVKSEGKYKIGRQKIKQFLNNEDAYSINRFERHFLAQMWLLTRLTLCGMVIWQTSAI